nr:hypothetical protein [Tanacetum cinerariifolium]
MKQPQISAAEITPVDATAMRTPRATRIPNPADVVQNKKRKQAARETSSPKPSLKVCIRQQNPSTTIPSPSDDRERDEIHEATQLSLALHKTAKAIEEKENVAAVKKKILEEYVEKIVEREDKESDATDFDNLVFF